MTHDKKIPRSSRRTLTRRSFLAGTAAVAGPLILPSGVLAQQGRPGANDRLIVGHIGAGGQGRSHLKFLTGRNDVEVAAVCDVDKDQLKLGLDFTGGKAQGYNDYRELLDRKDIDAVTIAAPDHWHGLMTVHACEAGKDVYVEKPASKTIEEGRAMLDAARRYKRVVQVGSQGRSSRAARASCDYVRNGQIGDVHRVECWHYENPTGGDPTKNGEPPPNLDWDMWLGPARWVPYNPDRVHFNFRWFLDFGGGQIRDRGAHVLSVVSWILDLDDRSPVRVTATGSPPKSGMWDCPPEMKVVYEFEDPDLTIVWEQPGTKAADHDFGAIYYGSSDNLVVRGGDGGTYAEEKALKYTPPAKGYHAFRSPGHHQNWFDCIKTREKPIMDIAAGHQVAKLCILANLSYRLERPIQWNGKKERIVGDDAANRLLGSPGRGQWHL
ncbi:MAG: Gfo/Idh/MocA family oxidoreductase [Candidatus Hydrogenedentes bacterium]|nr:Gfo/Idh/MocA family oxidoreductase [Candidatus Hydrogenedentota bacterium]